MGHEIVSIDEVGFQLATNYKKIWFERGKKPRRAFFWSNKKLIVFAAQIENKKVLYEFHIAQNSIIFMSFLNNLFEHLDKNKKYVFIIDNAAWHKTQLVKNYFSKQKRWIQVEFIPP